MVKIHAFLLDLPTSAYNSMLYMKNIIYLFENESSSLSEGQESMFRLAGAFLKKFVLNASKLKKF